MNSRSKNYQHTIDNALESPHLKGALHKFADAYVLARENAFATIDLEELRSEIAAMKDEVIEHNDELVDQFCDNAEKAGATIYRAATAEDANSYITDLANRKGLKLAVKSKSMASEETHLNKALEKANVRPVETDLGEWIIQLAGERPSHMVMPAIHMLKEGVADLFSKATGKEEPANIEHLVEVARNELRQEYLDADLGISGANMAIAETGGLTLVTNEGNARLVSTLPKTHVVLVGIEKIVPTIEDAMNVLTALPRNATGQLLTSYVTWIRGAVPSDGESKDLHIVLLDNGRSKLAKSESCKTALRCIKCGACANVCPVYQTVGGHVFGHIYISAIGVILTAFFDGLDKAAELVKACIGCRSCVAVCPSKIDLESIILHLRSSLGDAEGVGIGKSLVFKNVMRNRKLFHSLLRAASVMQKPVTKGERTIRHLPLFFSSLTEWRTLPAVAPRPFRDIFQKTKQQVEKPKYRIAFYAGCLNDFVYPELGEDLINVLNHHNVEVLFPMDQSCCGIPALYSGDRDTAKEMARQNIKAMLSDAPDFIVTTCPTCSMSLQRDFGELLAGESKWTEQAKELSEKTIDLAAFIDRHLDGGNMEANQVEDGEKRGKVTYHDSCHLKRGAGIWQEPRNLIDSIGLERVEMAHSDRCCGFGGSYSFTSHPEIAKEILADKLTDIEETGADCVAMDCPGCMMQIRGGLEKNEKGVRVAHTVELLAEALKK